MIDEERAKAQSEIEAARAATLRVEAALEQQAEALCFAKQQELEELRMQVKEAQRIMMLHGPSKVMDMEFQIAGLHQQLTDKALENLQLRKKLEAAKRQINGPTQFEIQGEERLGACLAIAPTCAENAPELHKCIIQWFSVSAVDGSKVEPIKGVVPC
jgi:alanine racemase